MAILGGAVRGPLAKRMYGVLTTFSSEVPNQIRGIYRHLKSGNLYNVVDVARSVEDPTKFLVIYKQMRPTNLKGTEIELPTGTAWARSYDDFNSYDGDMKKFRLIKKDQKMN